MEKVKLGDIYSISSGGTPSRKNLEYYSGGTINWVKTGDLKKKYIEETEERITDKGLYNSSTKIYNPGTVLIAMYGATIGETSILNIKACTNQACAAFIKNNKVIPEYLYYFFKSNKEKFVNAGIGGAQPNISIGYLKNVLFNLYEISEQEKIVDKLNKLEEIIDLRKKQIEELDELIKSKFVDMFGDISKNSKNYKIVNLSDISQYWNGLTYKPSDINEIGTIVLRSSNIQNGKLDYKDLIRVSCVIPEKKYVKNNDILMCSRNGSARLVGKVALINNSNEDMSFGAFMMIIRSEYYPYLMTFFQMDSFRAQISTSATTTINQITSNMMNNVKLPLPSMDEINKFAKIVEQIDKQKFMLEKSLKETEELQESLMNKYFN